ncbi:lipoprotein [Mycoplasma feriruminatoris]|uniref:hypothetical protein n=1 Tax=Mycoplasma feriruminatoris TaxID=1179777 RepID=UPI00241EFB2D|nr:hypothetical protein [Mycoplasma feriruminatoris]WFQ96049.1 lipoprotein [Mycoplasma feriruminatoris]
MKKFLTILSFLTTLSSSLVVACKTDNVGKEVKNKEDKNNQNRNPKNNNLKEKDTEGKEEKIEFKEEKTEKSTELEIDPNNNINKSNENDYNSGSLSDNIQNSPINEMPNDQASKDENTLKNESEDVKKLKKEVDDSIAKMDDTKIKYLFTELNSNLIQNEFNNRTNKISAIISEVYNLFDKYKTEDLKAQISDFIDKNSNKNYNRNDEIKHKLNEILSQMSKEEKNTIIDNIEQLLSNALDNELESKRKNLVSELDQLLINKQYKVIKENLYEMIEKSENIQKVLLVNDPLITS